MSLECRECEHDIRGGHHESCSKYTGRTLTVEHAYAAIDLLDWCKTHRVPWNELVGRCVGSPPPEGECDRAKVLLVEVDGSVIGEGGSGDQRERVEHMCGLMGFGEPGDMCPACDRGSDE
jgi:hypothetical protein